MNNPSNKFSAIIFMSLSLGSCAADQKIDSALNAVVISVQTKCKFVPTIFSIAAVIGVPGAPQGEKLVEAICNAANKAKADKAADAKSGNNIAEGRSGKFPAGVPLEFKINGKTVSGLTSN